MVRITGIEPVLQVPETCALPLRYILKNRVTADTLLWQLYKSMLKHNLRVFFCRLLLHPEPVTVWASLGLPFSFNPWLMRQIGAS